MIAINGISLLMTAIFVARKFHVMDGRTEGRKQPIIKTPVVASKNPTSAVSWYRLSFPRIPSFRPSNKLSIWLDFAMKDAKLVISGQGWEGGYGSRTAL